MTPGKGATVPESVMKRSRKAPARTRTERPARYHTLPSDRSRGEARTRPGSGWFGGPGEGAGIRRHGVTLERPHPGLQALDRCLQFIDGPGQDIG